jgi:hypothetical protein
MRWETSKIYENLTLQQHTLHKFLFCIVQHFPVAMKHWCHKLWMMGLYVYYHFKVKAVPLHATKALGVEEV